MLLFYWLFEEKRATCLSLTVVFESQFLIKQGTFGHFIVICMTFVFRVSLY